MVLPYKLKWENKKEKKEDEKWSNERNSKCWDGVMAPMRDNESKKNGKKQPETKKFIYGILVGDFVWESHRKKKEKKQK